MPESTLNLKKTDFEASVGLFLGFGRGALNGDPAWSTQQLAVIAECVNEGHRIFYYPEPEYDGAAPYDWSFLHPTATLTLPHGAQFVVLPDDFGGMEGSLTLLGSTSLPTLLRFQSEPSVRQLYAANPGQTGAPLAFAVAPVKGTTQLSSQRQQLVWFPGADQNYTAQFQYYLLPDALTANWPWSYGGAQHASTIREACLKVAENMMDDAASVHSQEFQKRLSASIGMDRKLKPQHGGRNIDRSDNTLVNPWPWSNQSVTFNGIDVGSGDSGTHYGT